MQNYIGVALRPADSDHQKLQNEWMAGYLPLVQALPGLRSYRWNGAGDRFERDTDTQYDPMPVLGFSQYSFDEGADLAAAIASPAGQALLEFESRHLARHMILQVEERIVIDPPAAPLKPGAVKTMSIIRRAEGLDMDGFLHEWRGVHVPLVRAIRQMKGYRQHLILSVLENWRVPVADADFPFDGAVELWQDSVEEAQAMADTPEAQAAFAHAARTSARIEKFQIGDVREWNAA